MSCYHQIVYLAVDFRREKILLIGRTDGELHHKIIDYMTRQDQITAVWIYQTIPLELEHIQRLMERHHLPFHEVACRIKRGYGNGTIFAA